MIGNIYDSKQKESLNLYFQICGFNGERDKYLAFKKGKDIDYNYDDYLSNRILMLLEKMGYSVNELGTYAYKNLIMEIINYLEDGYCEYDIINYLYNFRSQLYLDVAHDTSYADFGIKTFLSYIDDAFYNRNKDDLSKSMIANIFGDYKDTDYRIQAYLIACYLENNLQRGSKVKVKAVNG